MAKNQQQGFCDNVVITYKYNLLTYLPLFLFSQFKRVANVYFLLISILQLIPGLSPTGQFTTLATLIFVLAINGVKEAYEDYKRHRDDKMINNRPVVAIRDSVLVEMSWWQLQVGDICMLRHRESVPADCVVLATSEESGVCYVETSSLDGETNLKRRQAIPELQEKVHSAQDVASWKGNVRAEFPHRFISSFTGNLSLTGDSESSQDHFPIDSDQLILRGSSVRNTKLVWAMVVYTGDDTKLVLNSKRPPFKRTLVEKKTNGYIFAVFILLLLVSIGCAIGSGVYININRNADYLPQPVNVATESAINFLTFFILFGQMIPISLYTSMEIVRLFQGWWMSQDLSMYDPRTDTPMAARSTTLNEELGQVGIIFSDKTGTLTQNQMQFRKCIISGKTYGRGYTEIGLSNSRRRGEPIDETLISDESQLKDIFVNFQDESMHEELAQENGDGPLSRYWLALALCHTVVPEKDEDGQFEYQAASPDEMALVCAARQMGYFFSGRRGRNMEVTIGSEDGGKKETRSWDVLQVLEFDSDRKRMSVVLRDEQGKITLFCKGADVMIAARLRDGQEALSVTNSSLEVLGSEGLRTLMIGSRELDASFYSEWSARYDEGARLLDGRKEALDKLSEEIEVDLELVGATAIEDKLQNGVPDAIETLARAGIAVYCLTGDKQETAINIGYACNLLAEDMNVMILNASSEGDSAKSTEELLDHLIADTEGASNGNEKLALVVNGFTLRFALEEEFGLSEKFITISRRCKSVICCRVTPAQKAQVVKLHKTRLEMITLAIGDGANDVSMIQAAHVGIGISGEEGLQAVRSADYAIAQFRFLVPLLLLHGRYSFRRVTKLILYFFMKNVALVLTNFWYAIDNSFTGQSLFEEWTLALFNVVFTSVPIVIFAVLDEDISRQTVLMNPGVYKSSQRNEGYTLLYFCRWVAMGIWVSAAVYFIPYFAFSDDRLSMSGNPIDLWGFGWIVYTSLIFAVNLRLAQEVKTWSWPIHVTLWGSMAILIIWGGVYQLFWPALGLGYNMYLVFNHVAIEPAYWIAVFGAIVVALLPSFTWTYIQRTFYPSDYHVVQELDWQNRHVDMPDEKKPSSALFAPNPRPMSYTGYAFAAGDETALRRTAKKDRSRPSTPNNKNTIEGAVQDGFADL